MEEDRTKTPEIPGEDHAEFRETFVCAHPDVILTYMREPRRKFVERIYRDLYGARLRQLLRGRGDARTQRSLGPDHGLQQDVQGSAQGGSAESDVLDRLRAYFVALEYLNICDSAVPLRA